MNHASTEPTGLVPDANVLIDYVEADRGVLTLIAHHLAPIHIPSPVLTEVRELSLREATRLGLHVVEPTLDQVGEAAKGSGPTSFQDRLCLILARDHEWGCMTNDKALRRACDDAGLPSVWGLEAMKMLVQTGNLRAGRAWATARRIAAANPYITKDILSRFKDQIGD